MKEFAKCGMHSGFLGALWIGWLVIADLKPSWALALAAAGCGALSALAYFWLEIRGFRKQSEMTGRVGHDL